jgi:hypothetical protein
MQHEHHIYGKHEDFRAKLHHYRLLLKYWVGHGTTPMYAVLHGDFRGDCYGIVGGPRIGERTWVLHDGRKVNSADIDMISTGRNLIRR